MQERKQVQYEGFTIESERQGPFGDGKDFHLCVTRSDGEVEFSYSCRVSTNVMDRIAGELVQAEERCLDRVRRMIDQHSYVQGHRHKAVLTTSGWRDEGHEAI